MSPPKKPKPSQPPVPQPTSPLDIVLRDITDITKFPDSEISKAPDGKGREAGFFTLERETVTFEAIQPGTDGRDICVKVVKAKTKVGLANFAAAASAVRTILDWFKGL